MTIDFVAKLCGFKNGAIAANLDDTTDHPTAYKRKVLTFDEIQEPTKDIYRQICTYFRYKCHKMVQNGEAKWLYRLESIDPDNGLWYNKHNELVWGIGKIPDCETKYLPMDYDERYHKDGKNWFSSCSKEEDLSHWYSLEDAKQLIDNGFVFTRYLAVDYVEYDMETTFLRETAFAREVLNIEDIWRSDNNDKT